jgi:SAM-dependent methyltransferase
MRGSSPRPPRAPSPDELTPGFLALVTAEPLDGATAVDVGTGRGRVALALAPRCRHVVGIDRDAASIEEARRVAAALGWANAEFILADAEAIEYAAWAPSLVTAHLCVSDAIVERAGRALAPGGVFAFVAFHTDHWLETGRVSRFAYSTERADGLLARNGFAVEHLGVERDVRTFRSVEEALGAALGLEEKWRADGRWINYVRFIEEGGRTLTRSYLVGKARRR